MKASSRAIILFAAVSVLFQPVVAEKVDLTGGEVVRAEIFSGGETSRWLGVVGDSKRAEEPYKTHNFSEMVFLDGQTGDIIQKDMRGLSGGGYYYAAIPFVDGFDTSKIYALENLSSLDKGELFRENYFPAFYPDYSNYFDAPDETFTSESSVFIDGRNLSAARTVLEKDVEYYLLKYNTSQDGLQPMFVAPIDGERWGDKHGDCYDGKSCGFEFILPRANTSSGSQNAYTLSVFARQPAVQGCGSYGFKGTSFMLETPVSGREGSCLNLTSDNLTIDFANNKVEGDGTNSRSENACAARIKTSDVVLRDFSATNFTSAVCIEDERGVNLLLGRLESNRYGVDAVNSTFEVTDTEMNNTWDLTGQEDTLLSLDNVNLSGDLVSGQFFNLKLKSGHPPNISEEDMDLVSLPLELNVSATESFAYGTDIGFNYPSVNRTKIEPTTLYKISRNDSYSSSDPLEAKYIVEDIEEVLSDPETGSRFIFTPENITSFSILQVFGEKISPETETETIAETEVERVTEYRTETRTRVASNPILVDLNLSRNYMKLNRNLTSELSFGVTNYGDVPTGEIAVTAPERDSWKIGDSRMDQLTPGQSENGSVLLRPDSEAQLGNTTLVVAVMKNRSAIDLETVKVNIRPAKEGAVRVIESPRFLALEKSQEMGVSLLAHNPRGTPVNLTLSSRNLDECAVIESRNVTIESSESREVDFSVRTRDEAQSCQGLLVLKNRFKDKEEVMGFTSVSLSVEEKKKSEGILILPLILIAWTLYSLYVVLLNG